MARKIPVVAIVGRTNVGKSTLFNALVKHRRAIVKDTPGVTRDRNYAVARYDDFAFKLIDTGGMAGEEHSEFEDSVRTQAQIAVDEADLVLVVFDGLHGLHPLDSDVVNMLRGVDKPMLCIANKCEKQLAKSQATELYALGYEEIIMISAAHNEGVRELVQRIRSELGLIADENDLEVEPEKNLRLAILGKPNVGKSTLVNRLIGQDRVLVSDTAGTTRDSIDVEISHDGQDFTLIDTAGLRKRARIDQRSVERFGNLRTLRSLARCDVAVLLLDATQGMPSEQDAKIAGVIHDRGKPFLIAVNKWDLIEKDHRTAKEFKTKVFDTFKFARYAPIVFISALSGKRCISVLSKAAQIDRSSKERIKTSDLNKLMQRAFEVKPPPVYRGQPIKLLFATQTEVSPPGFVVFVNYTEKLNFSYERFLKNEIRKRYPFIGTDIRVHFRKRTEKSRREKQHLQRIAGNE